MSTEPVGTQKPVQKPDKDYRMSALMGAKVYNHEKKIGRLSDLMIIETGKLPEVKNLVITRPFGDPSLLVPWDHVTVL